jgi:hypothetical protein
VQEISAARDSSYGIRKGVRRVSSGSSFVTAEEKTLVVQQGMERVVESH